MNKINNACPHELHPKIKPSKTFSLTRHWMFSYTCILLLPIFLCLLYGIHTYESAKEQNINSLKENLTSKVQNTENHLQDIMTYFNHFYLHDNVYKLQTLTEETYKPASRVYFPDIRDDIAEISRIHEEITNIILYFPRIKLLIDKNTHITYELASEINNPMITPSLLDCITTALNENKNDNLTYITSGDNLYIGQKMHTNRFGQTTSYIIYQVNIQSLFNYLKTDVENISSLIIHTNDILVSQTETLHTQPIEREFFYPAVSLSLSQKRPILFSEYSNNHYLYSISSTCLNDFYYVYIIAKSAYDYALTSIITFFVIIMLLSLLLGALLISYFIKRNYRPVKEIISHINPNQSTCANEYTIILDTIKNNFSEMKRQQQALSNNYLLKMLSGEISFEESISNQSSFRPIISESHLCVSLIELRDCPVEDKELYIFIVQNVLSELLEGRDYTVLYGTFSSSVAVIFSCSTPQEHFVADIHTQHQFLYDFFVKNTPITLSIGFSDHWIPKEKLHQAYTQAKETLEYIKFYQCDPVFLYSRLPELRIPTSINIYNTKDVLTLVTNEEKNELTMYFDTLYQQFCAHPSTLAEGKNMIYYYYQLLNELQLYLRTRYSSAYPDHLENLDETFLQLNITEAAALTKKFFLDARELISSYKNNHMQLLVQQVRTYIDNNYFDVNMNQTTIANHFHITPAYLSQKFKDEYNVSIIQYLYSIRIEHSINLLKNKKFKISDIAIIVGFSNTNSYIRVFKQFIGVSPGKYIEDEHS